ncbi:Ig-like domain-containing protein [Flavobacterium johnsoniae]|uniref:Ig-like domain-containing protein n=1 Tax=Flavobacterium johnsoniae TaxID=986 RepID=UPI0025AF5F2F|nr:Ig-like domain-containing protein [Flavobacterium johnsoniae]WJS94590.1 Ig-like domain-containing protein [Flavobacterium johnsoniae]
MIKNYFTLNSVLNLKKAIALFFAFFIFSQVSNAQCAIPVQGCSGTNLSNFGADSNNDASSIEYDNFISSFHSTIVRTSDGTLQVWGERMANNGTANVLVPQAINRTNYPALTSGATPLKAALGSNSANRAQGILLATDGLYAWSTVGNVLASSLTTNSTFQKITIGGNSNGLPTGVSPGDVKMMFATFQTLAITTCSGDLWVISQVPSVRGNGGTGDSVTWYKVRTSAAGNPFLTNVVVCRGNSEGLMALRADGSVYVWGNNVLLGDNTAIVTSQTTARQMTLPASITPKMIGSTGISAEKSYYVLATNGNLYGLGENTGRQLGDWTTTDRLSWVQPRYTSAAGPVMNNIKWISVQEHDTGFGAINVINSSYNLYAFGQNDYNLLGTTGNSVNPVMPSGISASDRILAVETGGHTSMIVKACEAKYGYAGHKIRGSMGDGTDDTSQEAVYTFATANVQICGAESNPVIQPISLGGGPDSKYCIDDPVLLNPTPTGGVLELISGPGTLNGNTLSFTGVGTVQVRYTVTTSCGGTTVTNRNFEGALCPADLEITKVANNSTPSIGDNVIFTITAKNNGAYKATGVTVNDALPTGYTFVSATPSVGSWSAPTWTVGSLASNATATLQITGTVRGTGAYANTATISGNNPDGSTANNSATATPVVRTNLSVTKSVDNTTPNAGSDVTFTITASNAGPSAATGVKVTDVLPAGYTFVSASPSTGSWSAPDWTIGNLASGASTTLTMTVTVNASGSYANTASISGEQTDPTPGNNSGSVTPTVNHAPSAVNDPYTVNEDNTVTLTPLTNDSDVDGNTISLVSINGTAVTGAAQSITVSNGTINITASGVITFTPSANFNSTTALSIPYVITDGRLTATANILITVNAVNDNPVAVKDEYTVAEDNTVTLTPLANDTDVDGDTLSITSINGTALTGNAQTITVPNGTVNISAAGVITFTPSANFNSTTPISFPYVINDGHSGTATANIEITVTAVNDNPVAVKDEYTVAEDNTVTLTPLVNDTDVDGDTLSIASINGTALTGNAQSISVPNGTVNISAAGVITFTPSANFNSTTPISFPYVINDGHSGTATANIEITVTAVNDNPVAVKDEYTAAEDNTVTLTPLANDTDVDGDTLSIASINGTALTGAAQSISVPNGTVNISAAGVITFTPSANFNSTTPISFPYVINDGHSGTATANIEITVTAVNDNPVAVKDEYTVAEDNAVTLTPLANDTDVDGDTLSIASINGTALTGAAQTITVSNGTVNISAAGIITFTPSANFNSTTPISFPYVINDGHSGTATANIEITVTAVNDNPVAVKDEYTVAEDNAVTLTPLANDTDVDGDTLSITSINGTALTGAAQTITVPNGTVNISAAGVITFTPSANFNSTTPISFPYVINDGHSGTATANIEITVTAVNDNPVAVKDEYTAAEDNAVTLTPLANDTDVDGDTLSITSINGTALTGSAQSISVPNGTVNISAAGVITFTPSANFNSATPISFPYVINDGHSGTATANIEITVTAVNDNPVAVKDEYTVAEDNAVTLTPLANDTDVDGDTLSITSINGTALTGAAQTITVPNGTVNISAAGVMTFTPSANFNSTTPISFPYVINDGHSGTATANIEITVTAVNDNPVAVKDEYTAAEDNAVTLTPLANDTDVDGDTLSITSINGTALTGAAQSISVPNGTVNISAAGVITFTPSANFNSTTPISFPYVINDGHSGTATANIEITVTAVNDNPVAVKDEYTAAEDNAVTLTPLANDTDVDGDTLSITSINGTALTGAAQTIAVPNGTVNISAAGVITFTPSANFNSTTPISFPYVINDGHSGTATANIEITVTAVNDNPVAVKDEYTVAEDNAVTLTPLANDTDVDGDTLSITSINGTALTGNAQTITVPNGTVNISAAGVMTFTPSANFNSTTPISFPYVINDGHSGTATANIEITVTAVNDNPVAVKDEYTAAEDNAVTLTPLANDTDVDGDTLSITSINGTALTGAAQSISVPNGTVNISAAGVITFTPSANFNSTTPISFPYVINDGHSGTATANIEITVTAVNDNPVAVKDEYTAAEDNAVTLTPLANDTDVDGDTLSITSINGTALTGAAQTIAVPNGTVNISAAGVITFTPSANFNSTTPISFPYVINDGHSGTATANIEITVTAVNDNPVAVKDEYTVAEDNTVTLTPLANDTDVDGDTLSITSINGTALTGNAQTITVPNGTVNISAAGVITFAPSANFNSTTPISFPYVINDGHSGTATANIEITVTAVNDNPVAVKDEYTVAEDNAVTLTPLANDTDVDGDTLSITSINGTALTGGVQSITVPNGTVNISAAGAITFTPSANFNSTTPISFPYVINDGHSGTATANIEITVTAVNDNPVAVKDEYTVAEDNAVTLTPLANDTDVDGDTLSITSINGTALTGAAQTITVPNGTVNISAAGAITFTPSANFNSTTPISFPYVINDGHSGTATANIEITVTAVNDNPVAVKDEYTVAEDNTVTLTPLANDTDVDGDTLSITSINGTALTGAAQTIAVPNGTVNISAAGVITFTPSANFNSTAPISFPYVITDGTLTATADIEITVTAVNDAPIAKDDTNNIIASTAGATTINALIATDIDGTIASYTILSLPANGTLTLAGNPISLNQILTPAEAAMIMYTPSGIFTGNVTFAFTATDDLGLTALAPGNITIPVGNNAPVANDDTNTAIPSSAGATAIKALSATDSDGTIANYIVLSLPLHGTLALNGTPVTVGQVLIPVEAAVLTYDPSGTFSGNDSFTFTATDNNGAVDATPAVVTIPVEKRTLIALKDDISVVGINETVKVINVLNNDTLDNNPLTINDVNLNILTPDPNNVLTLKPDGTAELVPNAPAGTYTLTYEICEKANLGNCTSASVTVTVVAPTMTITAESYCLNNAPYVSYNVKADNFTPTGLLTINWIDSANRIVATQTNMPLSGNVLWPGATVNANNMPTDWPGWILTNGQWIEGNDGFELTRPAVTMQFTLNPTQSVVVNYPAAVLGCNAKPQFGIEAGSDNDITRADGLNGSLEVINVLTNDKLNGLPVNPEDVIITANNFPQGITLNQDGTIDVAPGTKGGDYTLTYQICEKANQNNCSSATVRIFVETPSVSLIMKVTLNDENGNGNVEAGETLTYTFTVTNTGNVALSNLTIADLLPGIVINGGPISLGVGQSDSITFTGTYTLTQADINAGSVTNQASVSGSTQSGILVTDQSDSENVNGDNPTVIELNGCSIKIYNAVSLNGDKFNERFYIRGIECYPENTVQIYNRWGILVFERDHYNNNDIVFKGYSEGRVTVKESNGLPEGTYYYILRYKDNNSKPKQEAGYLYLTR